ncbi:MAG: CoA-binding protein [Gammaproteobacteria bacterium]|nr:CoA-binding protein [Gammaproteobacteria bacterium]
MLGASPKPERYSNQALRLLMAMGYAVIPVNPGQDRIEGLAVTKRLGEIAEPVHTLTVYVNGPAFDRLLPEVLALKPDRVIFNPGAEAPGSYARLEAAGIAVEEACTLVLLRTGQF